MRPYQNLVTRIFLAALLMAASVPARTSEASGSASLPSTAADSLTRNAWEQYYNTNYDVAVRDFEKVVELHPDDAAPLNHLLAALVFRELYRAGALNSSLYSGDSFVKNTRQVVIDPKMRERIRQLVADASALSEKRLQAAPDDVPALYARGVTRGLWATYLGLVDKAWFAALRSAIGARRDHQRVLELDPTFADAKTVVGVHNYVAGSLPWAVKAAISVVGLSGSRSKGLEYLREAAKDGKETSVDARVALALFLRREQRYSEALDVVRTLTAAYPHNFLFALEEANLLKDWGKNQDALDAYRKLLDQAHHNAFYDPRLEFANFDLGEILRGRGEYQQAADAYAVAAREPKAGPDIRQRSSVAAGEMYDLLEKRDLALKEYQAAITADGNTQLAELARKRLKAPYRAN